MPIRGAVLTPTEVALAREACEPLLTSVTDRLLRGGLAAFAEFRQRYAAECQRAMSTSGKTSNAQPSPASTAASSTNAAAGQRVVHRINPEGLKSVFAASGVLFSPEEYRSILVAYSDAVGFVLAEDLLADLHPCRHAALDLIHTSTNAVAEGLFAELPVEAGSTDFPAVTVDSVAAGLSAVFDPAVTEAEAAAAAMDPPTTTACVSALTSLQASVEATFVATVYPDGTVPAEDVVAFVVLALQQHPPVASVVLPRLRQTPSLTAASPRSTTASTRGGTVSAATTAGGSGKSALFSICHRGVTTQRKFEYYGDSVDRRDEWVRGRQEADARPGYLRHVVGYGGHLPEYQYRFGRTFHVIEEDLPQLTKPKAPLEPVPADWYGEGVELKDSRMNAHHYRLA